MKKTTKLNKLALTKETIRPLKPEELQRANGGMGLVDTLKLTCSCGPGTSIDNC